LVVCDKDFSNTFLILKEIIMNVKLKSLVAAAVFTAAAIPAQAAVDLGSTGSSSALLTVVDFGANVSATFDLGLNHIDFAGGANTTAQTWDFSAGDYADAWTSFNAAASAANVQWFVAATDNAGNGAGARSIVSTSNGVITNLSTTQLVTATGSIDSFQNGLNFLSNHNTVANGASVSTATPVNAGFLSAAGKINNAGSVVAGAFGDQLALMQVSTGANGLAAATQTIFSNDFTFSLASNGTLVYAPIPEADTAAMLLAGLGLMGFIGRRRAKGTQA
jgi:hypothetical protein